MTRRIPILLLTSLLLPFISFAQEADPKEIDAAVEGTKPGEIPKAKTVPEGDKGEPVMEIPAKLASIPSPLSKMQALDRLLGAKKLNWTAIHKKTVKDVESSGYKKGTSDVPFMLGVRMADGLFAVKIQNSEELNTCADDIRDFARKLGVEDANLADAEAARKQASQKQWLPVVASLGFIQMKVMDQMKANEKNEDEWKLIMLGGWMQGARFAAQAVLAAEPPADAEWHPSYSLRDPALAKALESMLHTLTPASKGTPQVKLMEKYLPQVKEIISISIDPKKGKISREKVEKLYDLATEVVTAAIANKK